MRDSCIFIVAPLPDALQDSLLFSPLWASSVLRPKRKKSEHLTFPLHNGGDVAQEVELSSGSRRVAGSIPPWACRSVPEQDT